MEKDTLKKSFGIALIVIAVLIVLLLVAFGLEALVQAIAELALIAVGILATLGLQLLFSKKSTLENEPCFYSTDVQLIRSAITTEISDLPNLSYLNIHYSRNVDTADNPHRPYFIVNKRTKKAYWVRPELRILNKRGIIESNAHDGKKALYEHLNKNGISKVEEYSQSGDLE